MGLDVYLYRSINPEAVTAYVERQEDQHTKIYEQVQKEDGVESELYHHMYGTPSWDKYEKLCKEWDEKNPPTASEIEEEIPAMKSKIHPDHMCSPTYLRSSYNQTGTNHILKQGTGRDLYYIFDPPNDSYRFAPNWKACLERAKQVREAFKNYLVEAGGGVRLVTVSPSMFLGTKSLPKDEKEVMDIFLREMKKHNERFKDNKDEGPFGSKDFNWYGNLDGEFFLGKGARVLAAIPYHHFRSVSIGLVVADEDQDITKNWYLQALDVVVEMCEYVLSQEKPSEFCLHWSA